MKKIQTLSKLKKTVLFFVFIPVVVLSAALIYRSVSGSPLGVRSFVKNQIHSTISLIKAVSNSKSVLAASTGDYRNIIFLHHSIGRNLIDQGHLRELLTQAGFVLWDHDYNFAGLRNPDGEFVNYGYNIPGDNTDPDGLAKIFSQKVYKLPINTFSGLMQHEVIVIKSCYPVSNITSDAHLARAKEYYLSIRDRMQEYPEKIFIILTSPPLNPVETDLDAADRARIISEWLVSDEFLSGYPNMFVFDLFDQLAEKDIYSTQLNMLRQEYRNGSDSHPNQIANEIVSNAMVIFIRETVEEYRSKK